MPFCSFGSARANPVLNPCRQGWDIVQPVEVPLVVKFKHFSCSFQVL